MNVKSVRSSHFIRTTKTYEPYPLVGGRMSVRLTYVRIRSPYRGPYLRRSVETPSGLYLPDLAFSLSNALLAHEADLQLSPAGTRVAGCRIKNAPLFDFIAPGRDRHRTHGG